MSNQKPRFAVGSGLSFNQDRIELGQQYPQQVASTKDADKDVLPQKSPEASVMPLNPFDDVDYQSRIQRR